MRAFLSVLSCAKREAEKVKQAIAATIRNSEKQSHLVKDGMICQHVMTQKMKMGQSTEDSEVMQESETETDVKTESLALPEANITTLKDAIALEDVQSFLESHGHMSTSMTYIWPAVDALTALQIASMRQNTLHDFFQPSS